MTKQRHVLGIGFALVVASIVALFACAAVRAVLRPIADVAHDVCEHWATEHPEATAKLQLTPQEFCQQEEYLRPFIDAVLAAKRTGGAVVGAKLGLGHGEP